MLRIARNIVVFVLVVTALAGRAQAMPEAPQAPGDLDYTFGGFGVNGVANHTGLSYVESMTTLPDGRILTVGTSAGKGGVVRFMPNGVLDFSFGVQGVATITYPGFSVFFSSAAVQPDGKIVVVGAVYTSPPSFVVARLTAAGTLDTTFGSGGFVATDFDSDEDFAFNALIQPDGKIIAVGQAIVGGDYDFAVARYTTDGVLDNTFGGDGKVTIGFGGEDTVHDAALQPDGKLVIVGMNLATFDDDFAIARLKTDGSLDGEFDNDGKLTTGFGDDRERALAVVIAADGTIFVAGQDEDDSLLARYLPNGALDPSFDGDGKRRITTDDIEDAEIQPDGRIVLLGSHVSPNGSTKMAFYRLNADGSPDVTFDGDGDAILDLGEATGVGRYLALLPDGRMLARGSSGTKNVMVQLRPDGAYDTGGQQTLGLADPSFGLGSDESALAMAVQPDGKVVVVGEAMTPANTESDLIVARFLRSGLIDTTFGDKGRVTFGIGQYDVAKAVVIQPDGKIVVAGTSDPPGSTPSNFLVVRFNADGSKDNSFAVFGFRIADFLGGDDYGNALALGPDSKIVVAGPVWNGARFVVGVARINPDGTPDETFGSGGLQLSEWVLQRPNWVTSVVVQPDGGIVVGGFAAADFALMRFSANGNMDAGFGTDAVTYTNMGGDDYLNALTLTPSGTIVAAGGRNIDGNTDFALAEYSANGILLDAPNSWPGGKAFVDMGGAETAFAVDARADGQVVAAGCADGGMAWAQLPPGGPTQQPVKGTADFAGSGECASAVAFYGPYAILTAGSQSFNEDRNMALASFRTTPVADVVIQGLSASNSSPTQLGGGTTFSATVTSGTNIAYVWDFGDGTPPGNGNGINHTYATPGTFIARVTVSNGLGSLTAATQVVVTGQGKAFRLFLPVLNR